MSKNNVVEFAGRGEITDSLNELLRNGAYRVTEICSTSAAAQSAGSGPEGSP